MIELQNALEKLVEVHGKYNLRGSFNKGSVLAWPEDLPISPELEFFYTNFTPLDVKVDAGFFPIKLISMQDIQKSQIGYKWIGKPNDLKVNNVWPDEYVVIADDFGGGKPIIAVTNEAGTPVFANYSSGNPFKIANSLSDFFKSLTSVVAIVYGQFNIFEITDDDDVLLPEFVTTIKDHVTPILGEKNFQGFYDYLYG